MKSQPRFFRVTYMPQGGGQVLDTLVEFYRLTETGKRLTEEGLVVLSCKEVQ